MAVDELSNLSELHVHPSGWESDPQSEEFPLEPMGHFMPKIYVLVAEVFSLPEGADTKAIAESMTVGLESTLSQFPILTGVLKMDADDGRMRVAKKRESTLSMYVKYMLRDNEFPSYKELEERDVKYPCMSLCTV
jgi:hypothetical protein